MIQVSKVVDLIVDGSSGLRLYQILLFVGLESNDSLGLLVSAASDDRERPGANLQAYVEIPQLKGLLLAGFSLFFQDVMESLKFLFLLVHQLGWVGREKTLLFEFGRGGGHCFGFLLDDRGDGSWYGFLGLGPTERVILFDNRFWQNWGLAARPLPDAVHRDDVSRVNLHLWF